MGVESRTGHLDVRSGDGLWRDQCHAGRVLEARVRKQQVSKRARSVDAHDFGGQS
jgi:hypothetical protein